MIFDVPRMERKHIERIHDADHLHATEGTECVTREAQANRRRAIGRWPALTECENVFRSRGAP